MNLLASESIPTLIATVSAEATTERALAEALGAVRRLWRRQTLPLRQHAPAGAGAGADACEHQQHGYGHEHAGGHSVAEEGGQINMATPNVQTITGNLAALVAFTRAIQWVSRHWYTAGRPVCVRYSNAYGAMIASGTWKAKKHKAMAAEARAAWKALKRQVGEQLWLRHVVKPGEHQWARGANVLAGRGKQGTRTQVEHMRR